MLNKNLFRMISQTRKSVSIKRSTFNYKIFSHEPFNKAVCKQTYWDNLTQADKEQHYAHGAYNGITMSGKEFLNLVGKCHIILSNDNIIKDTLTVGSMIENSDQGIEFKPVTGIAVQKGDIIYYMSILNDSKISIEGNYLTRTYKANMLIVENIWVPDEDYINHKHRQWVCEIPSINENNHY